MSDTRHQTVQADTFDALLPAIRVVVKRWEAIVDECGHSCVLHQGADCPNSVGCAGNGVLAALGSEGMSRFGLDWGTLADFGQRCSDTFWAIHPEWSGACSGCVDDEGDCA